ncbi:MAG: TIGR02587 family membrane protein [Cyanobacteria bacterium J06614_10]
MTLSNQIQKLRIEWDRFTSGASDNIWTAELRVILKGAAGSFLFGIPLLYTVEVWSIGSSTNALRLLLVQGFTFVVVLLLTQIEGFRRSLTIKPIETVLESIEALGIGIICAAIALLLLRRITVETPLSEALGKLIFEGVPFSLGVTLARSTLERQRSGYRRTLDTSSPLLQATTFSNTVGSALSKKLADLDATLIGAIVIAFSIAPTEEVTLIAADLPPLWLLLVMAASLIISYIIVFASGFTDRSERAQRGLLLTPLSETLISYIVVLIASTVMLVFFQQLTLSDPWQEWLSSVIVLGLPASVGGAAGRILV